MNTKRAKTIEIFLPDGDPKSIKIASITSRTVEATYIPRANLMSVSPWKLIYSIVSTLSRY